MSFAERVLPELDQGQWTLSSIAPSFERRLVSETKTQASEENISELCMSFYSKTPTELISLSGASKEAATDKLRQQ